MGILIGKGDDNTGYFNKRFDKEKLLIISQKIKEVTDSNLTKR